MSEPVANQFTAIVRTLIQMLWGFLLAKLVAIPALEPVLSFLDDPAVEVAVVGFCTALFMALVAVLVAKVNARFGYLFVIAKKPNYILPPGVVVAPPVVADPEADQ